MPWSLIEDCLFLGVVLGPALQIWETNGPEIEEEICKKKFVVEGKYLKVHFCDEKMVGKQL